MHFDPSCWYSFLSTHLFLRKKQLSLDILFHIVSLIDIIITINLHIFSHANHWNLQPTTIPRLTLTQHSNNFQLACTHLHSYHATPLHLSTTIYIYISISRYIHIYIYMYIYIYIRVATPASVLHFTSPNPRVRLITHSRHTLDNMINLLYYYYLVKLI